MTRWRPSVVAIGALSAAVAALLVLIWSGALDFVAHDGEIETTAIWSVIAYWMVLCVGILLVTHFRRRWRELLMLVASITVIAGISEIAARHIFPVRTLMRFHGVRSEKLHHEYPKNLQMYMGSFEGEQITVRTNSDGLRSEYSRDDFLKYDNRIVILGDSFTFGLGVREERTFPMVTEALLREQVDGSIALLNAGAISYSPFLTGLQFRDRLREYRPTLVFLFLDASDIGDDVKYSQEAKWDGDRAYFDISSKSSSRHRYYGALFELTSPLLEPIGTYLAYPFERFIQEPYDYYSYRLEIGGVIERNRFFIYRHPLEQTRTYFDACLANIKDLDAQASELGARFVLVIAPRYHHWNPNECPLNWERSAYTVNEPYQFEYFRYFEERRDQLEFPVLNLLPAFQQATGGPLVFESDPHWTEKGHAVVADILTHYIIESGLLR